MGNAGTSESSINMNNTLLEMKNKNEIIAVENRNNTLASENKSLSIDCANVINENQRLLELCDNLHKLGVKIIETVKDYEIIVNAYNVNLKRELDNKNLNGIQESMNVFYTNAALLTARLNDKELMLNAQKNKLSKNA